MNFPSKKPKEILQDELAANKADFDLTCEHGGCITFTETFRYDLRSLISWDLTDNSNVQQRIGYLPKHLAHSEKSFCNHSLKGVTRVRLFTAIVINLLLLGCELWKLTAGQRQNLGKNIFCGF